jgi:hypothetical protein
MSLMDKYKSAGGGDKGRIGEGTFPARIVQILDLGKQEDEWKGETFIRDKLWLTFEFPTETITYTKDNVEVTRPRWLSGEFTKSTGDKAKLTPIVKATNPDAASFEDLLNCALLVEVGTTSGGKDKYASAMALPKGMVVAPLDNETKYFDMAEPDMLVYESLPDFLKEKMKESPDFAPF